MATSDFQASKVSGRRGTLVMDRLGLSRLRFAVEYGLLQTMIGLIRALPHGAARRVGAVIGELAHLLDRRHRFVARNNLALALPELSEAERRRLARRCFRHLGGMFCDNLSLARFDAVELCRRLTLEGWDHLRRADEQGRGVLILSAHFGNWEVLAHPVALYRGPMHFVARPADNPLIERRVRQLRERFGNASLPKRGSARQMLQVLRSGGRLTLLIDQRVHPNEGIEVPFFGHPAMTTPLLAKLSLRTGSPVVPVFAVPEPGGRFRVAARPAIEPQGRGDEAIRTLTARYLEVIEAEIRARPHMWMWMHERWLWLKGHRRWRPEHRTV